MRGLGWKAQDLGFENNGAEFFDRGLTSDLARHNPGLQFGIRGLG